MTHISLHIDMKSMGDDGKTLSRMLRVVAEAGDKSFRDDSNDYEIASFWDYLLDMYSPVEDLDLRIPKTGVEGFQQDRRMISSYFDKVLAELGNG